MHMTKACWRLNEQTDLSSKKFLNICVQIEEEEEEDHETIAYTTIHTSFL